MTLDQPCPARCDLVLVEQPGGVLVAGKPEVVESVVARLVDLGGAGVRVPRDASAADLAAVVATGGALAATHGSTCG